MCRRRRRRCRDFVNGSKKRCIDCSGFLVDFTALSEMQDALYHCVARFLSRGSPMRDHEVLRTRANLQKSSMTHAFAAIGILGSVHEDWNGTEELRIISLGRGAMREGPDTVKVGVAWRWPAPPSHKLSTAHPLLLHSYSPIPPLPNHQALPPNHLETS
jgi:hypothetical protein